jgi:hypothetical protein
MDALQEQFECWVGDQVIKRYNTDHGMSFQFHQRAGEAPDLEYRDGSRSLKVEVSTAYYDDKEHAKFVWLAARKQPEAPHKWSGVDFDKKLVENINERLDAKCRKYYGPNCVLAVYVFPILSRVWEMELCLKDIRVPATNSFDAIFLCGDFPPAEFKVWKLV